MSRKSDTQRHQTRRVKFERHPSQVVFDPSTCDFVVTWTKCGRSAEERIAARRDPLSWIPSVSAVATLYDRGCIPQGQVVYAAMAIGRAWAAGDRDGLDTEEARKAAELVHDLSAMCVNASSPNVARDVGQAMRHLLDEMAAVRLSCTSMEDLDEGTVMPPLVKSARECMATSGFPEWPMKSMRRRFMFCLNRRERTPVAYTLVSLAFDSGACPLLPLSCRRTIRTECVRESGLDREITERSLTDFFRAALKGMRSIKIEGRPDLNAKIDQKRLAEILSGSSPA